MKEQEGLQLHSERKGGFCLISPGENYQRSPVLKEEVDGFKC